MAARAHEDELSDRAGSHEDDDGARLCPAGAPASTTRSPPTTCAPRASRDRCHRDRLRMLPRQTRCAGQAQQGRERKRWRFAPQPWKKSSRRCRGSFCCRTARGSAGRGRPFHVVPRDAADFPRPVSNDTCSKTSKFSQHQPLVEPLGCQALGAAGAAGPIALSTVRGRRRAQFRWRFGSASPPDQAHVIAASACTAVSTSTVPVLTKGRRETGRRAALRSMSMTMGR